MTTYTAARSIGCQTLSNAWLTMRQRINLGRAGVAVDATQACESILPVDVHCTRATNSLTARSSECQRRVHFVLDLDERVKDLHKTTGTSTPLHLNAPQWRVSGIMFRTLRARGGNSADTDHGACLVEVNGIRLKRRLLRGLVWVLHSNSTKGQS